MCHADKLQEAAPVVKALFDQAILAGRSDQINKNAIPLEHAHLVARYISDICISRRVGVMRSSRDLQQLSQAAGEPVATVHQFPLERGFPLLSDLEIALFLPDSARDYALEMLKTIVEYDGRISEMQARISQLAYTQRIAQMNDRINGTGS